MLLAPLLHTATQPHAYTHTDTHKLNRQQCVAVWILLNVKCRMREKESPHSFIRYQRIGRETSTGIESRWNRLRCVCVCVCKYAICSYYCCRSKSDNKIVGQHYLWLVHRIGWALRNWTYFHANRLATF